MTKQHRTKLTARHLIVPAVMAAGVLASPAISFADTSPITCGVVTSDVRLRADLLDCAGPGLVVGASGVTIDLAGHVIDGTGSATGIDNEGGHDDLRITGGTVRGFRFGVELFETSGARLDRLIVESNLIGVVAGRSSDIELDRVTVDANVSSGIDITFSDGVAVRRSSAVGNGFAGVVVRFSDGTVLERNTATGNDSSGLTVDGSTGVRAERNHTHANGFNGIEVVNTEDAVIDRNEAGGNVEHGISIDRPGNVVSRNRTFDNEGFGISAPDGTIDGRGNQATGNLAGDCTGVAC
ncbi:MAG: right-handed parallel beta-helix repeat-containing protein [Ilumatobacteraceae bacterium]